jgi:hypothetical protein
MADDDCGEHCPFLNRSDRRCSAFLSLDRIAHAFDYCFGGYKSCPMYLELLAERRVRRICGMLAAPADSVTNNAVLPHAATASRPLVQITVCGPSTSPAAGRSAGSHRFAQSAAAA